jgi:hypothetical protein
LLRRERPSCDFLKRLDDLRPARSVQDRWVAGLSRDRIFLDTSARVLAIYYQGADVMIFSAWSAAGSVNLPRKCIAPNG